MRDRALGADERGRNFVDTARRMLARPDFLLPLAAAEHQFRRHYYQLNAAALLEDLFFDALGSYLRQFDPAVALERPPTGQKGWDYSYDGLRLSHKVGSGPQEIAAIWDATITGRDTWTFDEPIVYVARGNGRRTGSLGDGAGWSAKAETLGELAGVGKATPYDVWVVHWPEKSQNEVALLAHRRCDAPTPIRTLLPFEELWKVLHEAAGRHVGINEVEVLVTRQAPRTPPIGATLNLEFPHRSGVHLFDVDLLTDVPVKANNRGLLVSKERVGELMREARRRHLYAPYPLWFMAYANSRPPDLFAVQRIEYDALFSPRRSD